MKRIIVVLLLLFIPDCAVHRAVHLRYSERGVQAFRKLPINWNFSCDFPIHDRPAVREGFTYWNGVLGREVFKEADGCGLDVLMQTDIPRVTVLFMQGPNPTHPEILATANVGLFEGVPRSAVLRYYSPWAASTSMNSKRSVSRHEVGHVLGFEHSDFGNCLMYPKIDMVKYSRKPKQACNEEIKESRLIYGRKD